MDELGKLEVVDYFQQKVDRITFAWEDSEVFKKFLHLNSEHAMTLQNMFVDLFEKRWIDTAEGKQLDIIGKIVGQQRLLLNADLLQFFGFFGDVQAGSFGSASDPSLGYPFYSLGAKKTGNILLNDEQYRLFIKARIIKNTSRATPEDLIHFANFVFSTKGSTIYDEKEASFMLLIGKQLTREEIGLLKYRDDELGYESRLIPKPIGVNVHFGSYDYNSFFAFLGVPNAKGFGELSLPTHDGTFKYNGDLQGQFELKEGMGGKFMSFHGEL